MNPSVLSYQLILPLLVYVNAVTAEPQDSNATYVEIQPPANDDVARNITDNEYSLERLLPTLPETTATVENSEFVRDLGRDDVTTDSDAAFPETTTGAPEATTTRAPVATTRPPRTYTKPSPRFISKLSYFNKSTNSNGASPNAVEKSAKGSKRRYKSRCRCEKIWNCPKLQITVPRCPEEYFLCCF